MPGPGADRPAAFAASPRSPVEREIQKVVERSGTDLAAAYAERGYRPIWLEGGRLGPAAAKAVEVLASAHEHDLPVAQYLTPDLRAALAAAATGDASASATADAALTSRLAAFIADVHRPAPDAGMIYSEPTIRPRALSAGEVARRLGQRPAAELPELLRSNREYEALRTALGRARSTGDRELVAKLRLNLARARALPASPGREYILVNIAAQELELWRDDRLIDRMPVVIGSRSHPTPAISGVVRFAVLQPYWHMPPDLAASRIAPAMLSANASVLSREDLEVVSAFAPGAASVDPATVDWAAAAAGRTKVFLRQRPGPHNMMGRVKFIFPNATGVYLHDTPLKADFDAPARTASAGCIRLSDASRLARLLLGKDLAALSDGTPEQIVRLPRPVPIYLVYLTARAGSSGVALNPDVYGLDARASPGASIDQGP